MNPTPLSLFNPRPRIERIELVPGQACFVIDDALREPQRLVELAALHAGDFQRVDFNAYPGVLLPTPGAISQALDDFFVEHLRRFFDARRVVRMHSRLALVTLPARELQPLQCICHVDRLDAGAGQSIQASVLYLFEDAGLGGTSFYVPARPAREMEQLFADANVMTPEQFTQRHGIAQAYLCESNAYFRRVGGVAPKWNRLIFYDGAMLHSGDILAPERLSADPRQGRLTLNGFFTSRRRAA
jgi:hypothetical protein